MSTPGESLEDMQHRHRKEQKDLLGRITQKKKGASKKTRKGVNSECDALERQLKERHEGEHAALNGHRAEAEGSEAEVEADADAELVDPISESLEKTAIVECIPPEPDSGDNHPKKRNRQKERLARRKAEEEAAVEEASKEALLIPDKKAIERKRMMEQITAKGLTEKLIRPDGHCLFSAVADQLSTLDIPLQTDPSDAKIGDNENETYKIVRRSAANYMESHPDDFVAWLDESLEGYVEKIRDTAEWGGHLELLALAKTYGVQICVIQDGETQIIEPDEGVKEPERIWLGYYRHGFGLGEHYNSLRKSP